MDVFAYIASLDLKVSDWLFFAIIIPLGWFLVRYGAMTKWWKDVLGWFVFLMALSFTGFYILIAYAVLAGGRADEFSRSLVMVGVILAWLGKDLVLERERYRGRLAKRRLRERNSQPRYKRERS